MSLQISQVAVAVYIHICPDSHIAMTVDDASNTDVAAKNVQLLNMDALLTSSTGQA